MCALWPKGLSQYISVLEEDWLHQAHHPTINAGSLSDHPEEIGCHVFPGNAVSIPRYDGKIAARTAEGRGGLLYACY